jgi:hypothetical protein
MQLSTTKEEEKKERKRQFVQQDFSIVDRHGKHACD